nr:tRNA-splicing endonuclease subunit Sen2-like [Labrus bergylta]XP_020482778.2 tRNA-splicing endonuclease subunit Sen2-like [Labrus bergylta]
MQAEFRAPRRRPRVYEDYEAPLPVSRSPEERSDFRAELINQHVLVCHQDHIQKIHNQGYFGKGILSRARPDHSISNQWEQHEGVMLPVISQSRSVTSHPVCAFT